MAPRRNGGAQRSPSPALHSPEGRVSLRREYRTDEAAEGGAEERCAVQAAARLGGWVGGWVPGLVDWRSANGAWMEARVECRASIDIARVHVEGVLTRVLERMLGNAAIWDVRSAWRRALSTSEAARFAAVKMYLQAGWGTDAQSGAAFGGLAGGFEGAWATV